jgi:hypothetical protein
LTGTFEAAMKLLKTETETENGELTSFTIFSTYLRSDFPKLAEINHNYETAGVAAVYWNLPACFFAGKRVLYAGANN